MRDTKMKTSIDPDAEEEGRKILREVDEEVSDPEFPTQNLSFERVQQKHEKIMEQ